MMRTPPGKRSPAIRTANVTATGSTLDVSGVNAGNGGTIIVRSEGSTDVSGSTLLAQGGPTGGNLDYVFKLDTVIASRDVVAADTYAVSLFEAIKLEKVEYISIGTDMGLGRSDLENLNIQVIQLPV